MLSRLLEGGSSAFSQPEWLWSHIVGFGVAGLIGAILDAILVGPELQTSAAGQPVYVIHGYVTLVFGLLVGALISFLLQNLALLRTSFHSPWWFAVSLVGMAIGLAISLATGLWHALWTEAFGFHPLVGYLSPLPVLLVCGASVSVAQWVLLRKIVPRAFWWIFIGIAAWGVSLLGGRIVGIGIGMGVGTLIGRLFGETGGHIGGYLMMWAAVMGYGLTLGLISGVVLQHFQEELSLSK